MTNTLSKLRGGDKVLKLKNFKKVGHLSFQDKEKYEHVGLIVTSSQDGKGSQDDDKRLDLADNLKEAQDHKIKRLHNDDRFTTAQEVIVNGDSVSSVASTSAEGPIPPKTAKQKPARKNELKAKSTLMLAIPDEHLLKFHA
nr:hypothetical protein [Tanacetum cinerariifolium]